MDAKIQGGLPKKAIANKRWLREDFHIGSTVGAGVYLMTMKVTEEALSKDYIKRINLALNYIDKHLGEPLPLDQIAREALYSPFHFHRIFKGVIGETVNNYILRRRLERAALSLLHDKPISMAQLATDCGFNSNSAFSRAFRNHFGASPKAFQSQTDGYKSKIRQIESKNGQKTLILEQHICNIDDHLNWISMNANIEVMNVPARAYAGITHIGFEGLESAFEKVLKWARAQELMTPQANIARIFHDSVRVTSPEKVRMTICLLTEAAFEEAGEIKSGTIEDAKNIVAHLEITPAEFENAWSSLFVWMNDNGYKKAPGNPFEVYHNDFRQHPEGKCIVDLHIPVE